MADKRKKMRTNFAKKVANMGNDSSLYFKISTTKEVSKTSEHSFSGK